jgi:general secretion pathway protein A
LQRVYTEFYNLKEIPFDLTPSPRFVYLGENHKEALALLTYGVTERKGFILLTGEIGTGKTTMVKTLISNLDANIQYVYLSNPLLSQSEFIDYLAFSAFRKKVHFKSHANFLLEFEKLLRQCLADQKNFILIVDEAQDLSFELLDEIKILSEMEFASEKLINIFLVGQIELNEKLRDPRCSAIQQSIKSRYQILPLDLKCTREYLATRLSIAGATDGNDIFSESAIEAIYQYSEGIPRMINSLADNTLLLGYVRGKRKITAPLVKQCYDDMGLKDAFPESRKEESVPHEIRKKEETHRGRQWKWAAVILLMLLILAAGMSRPGRSFLWQMTGLKPISHQVPPDKVTKDKVLLRQKINREKQEISITNDIGEQISSHIQVEAKEAEPVEIIKPEAPKEMERLAQGEDKKSLKSVHVKEKNICQYVVDLRPVGAGSRFNNSVGMLYCFTKISVSRIPNKITHVWYLRDTERARVNLPIKSYTWRTYSSKTIRTDDIGDWRVDVLGPEGKVLSTLRFKITQ